MFLPLVLKQTRESDESLRCLLDYMFNLKKDGIQNYLIHDFKAEKRVQDIWFIAYSL